MTELKRLEISGIRSFKENPDDINTQSIDFEGPVTLITGKNGSGKSTIIEALKYATTGNISDEMVSDLNIWGKNKINSKVSLLFKSANNNTYNFILNSSLSKSRNTIKESTLSNDGCTVSTTKPNGQQESKSTDISELPKLFGASKAIIENVIFCAQNDSCWPIDSTPTKLKEKFDQIFGTADYNKSIKILTKKVNDLDGDIEKYTNEIDKYQIYKDNYLQSKEKLEENQKEIEKLNSEIISMKSDLDSVNEQLNNYEKIQSNITVIENEILKSHGELESQKNNLNLLKKRIKKIPQNSNLESINNSIKSLKKDFEDKKNLLDERIEEQKSLEIEIEKIKNNNEKLENFKLEQKFYSQKLQQFIDLFNNENLDETLKQKEFIYEEADENLNKLNDDIIKEKYEEMKKIEINLSNLNDKMETLKENVKSYEIQSSNDIDEKQNEIKEAQKKLDDLICLNENPEILKQKIECNKTVIKDLISHKNELLLMKEKCNKTISFKDQINSNLMLIRDALNDQSIDQQNVKNKFDEKISALKKEIDLLNNKYSEINEKYIYTKIELKNAKSDFKSKQNEDQKVANKIEKVLSIFNKNYKEALDYVEDLLNKKIYKLNKLNCKEKVYVKFKKLADDHHSCPLCKSEFASDTEFHQSLFDHLDDSINSIKNKIDEVQKEKQKYELDLIKLKEIEDDVKIYDNFQSNKVNLLNNISKLQERQNDLSIELENIKKDIKCNKEIFDNFYKLSFNVENLVKEKNSPYIDQNSPSFEKVQNKIDLTYEKIENLVNETMNLYDNQYQFSNDKNTLESNIKMLKHEYDEMTKYFNDQNELQLTANKIQEFEEKHEKLKSEYEELKSQFNKEKDEKTKIKNNAQIELNKCNDLISEIKKSKEKIQKFESTENMSNLKIELKTIESQYNQITNEINSLKQSISQLKDEKSELELINDYLTMENKCNEINSKLENLEVEKNKKLGESQTVNIKELTIKQKILNDDLIKSTTNIKNKEKINGEELEKIKKNKPYLKLYNETVIRLNIIKKSKSDIELYINKLDKSIVQYHTDKMSEINDNIDILWSNTYYGRDINSIFIRCEKETKNKNINYNYYVVMKKNNAEMNMKNRCSAGQKMLASIIIRLAIAQTFAKNCGIIALDEPTTNIDNLNKNNLALQLINLIDANDDDDKKIHLIIITHNRDFAQSLVNGGKIRFFYQIKRDANESRHSSQIIKCNETNLIIDN